jgi:Holliday junction resolvase
MSETNETTRSILKHLYEQGIFAWRTNVTGIPLPGGGFRPAAKKGLPDLMAILPGGKFLGIEVKTGRDKLRPEQIGFIANTQRMGAEVIVVKDFKEFLDKYESYCLK